MNPFRRALQAEAVPEDDPAPPEPSPAVSQLAAPTPASVQPPVQPPVVAVDAVGHLDEMDVDIASRWDLWSAQIGHAIHPVLVDLEESLPGIRAVMVCTADGLNVCALGLEETQVGRLSALATSLFAVGSAASQVVRSSGADSVPRTVSIHDGDDQTVVVSIRGLVVGSLLLWVTAHDTAPGSLLVRVKQTATRLGEMLSVEPESE